MSGTAKIAILLGVFCAILPAAPVCAHPEIEEQIRAVERRMEQDPDNAALYLQRGELHRIHRDWADAEADYRRASDLDPGLAIIEYCRGRLKLESGDPDSARQLLDSYLQKRPNDANALAARGRALVQLGEQLAAARDLGKAIEHASEANLRPGLYLEQARALMAAGPEQLDNAVACLDAGLEKLGEPVALQLYAVELETEGKRYNAALRRIDRLASQAARQEPWLMRKGAILEAAGRRGAALEAYRAALKAVDALPQSRRGSRAVTKLEAEARAAIERLDVEQASE